MMVLSIFLMAVVVLSVYFAFNMGVDPKETETGGFFDSMPPENVPETEPPLFSEDMTEVTAVADEDMHHGYLILVNSDHEYSFGQEDIVVLYHNEEKSPSYGLLTASISCEHSILPHLNRLMDDYVEASGDEKAIVNSGYRTYAEQEEELLSRIESDGEEAAYKYVAVPGHSEHHTGLGLDIGANADRDWVIQNSYRYGFVQRYRTDKIAITGIAYEYWHYRYVGEPHAEIMFRENLCLEEYIKFIHEYTYEYPYLFVSEDGISYMIYHVGCEYDGETSLRIPRGYEYAVSGDNVDGFIVTVTLKGGAL